MTGPTARRRRKGAAIAGGVLLFLLSAAGAFFLSLPREVLLDVARGTAGKAGFVVDARDARTVFPLSVRFDNVTLRRSPGAVPLPVDRAEIGLHPVGIFFWAPLRVTLVRGEGRIDSGSTLSFTRGRIRGTALSSSDLSIPADSGFSFRLDEGECQWNRGRKEGDASGTGTLRFRELRIPLPETGTGAREALLKDVAVKFAVAGKDLRISSLTGAYEDTRVEGTGEILSLFGPGEATVSAQIRVVNPLSGRVATLFDMTAKNVRNATFRLAGPLRSPRGEIQLF